MDKKNMINKFVKFSKANRNRSYSRAEARDIVDDIIKITQDSLLKEGDYVRYVGFGTMKVVKKKARRGRNPSTGQVMDIPEALDIKFRMGAPHREHINSKN